MTATAPAIEVHKIHKTYGQTTAVDDISFRVERGEIFGIIGPNGAGKTTTVECVTGLRRPDAGEIRVLGLDPRRHGPELRQRIGIQLQHAAIPDRMKVWEALDLFASFYQRPANWSQLIVEWGLAEKRDTVFAELSGGQQQRLFIALSLVCQPELVVLDELTSGLDPVARRTAWSLVRSIRERGVTVVLVTHYLDEVERLCDRVAVLNRGHLVALNTPAGLIGNLMRGQQVRFRWRDGFEPGALAGVAGVRRVSRLDEDVIVEGEGPLMARVATALAKRDIIPLDLRTENGTLEDAYLALTGEAATTGPPVDEAAPAQSA